MTYISFKFALFLVITLSLFYLLPLKKRWYVLLLGSFVFYYLLVGKYMVIFVATIVMSYIMANVISKCGDSRIKIIITVLTLASLIVPLWVFKYGQDIATKITNKNFHIISIVGISFYTLQIISYIVDVFKEKISPERNLFRYALFVSYFPQIIQGPIPRYNQLSQELFNQKQFNEDKFSKGIMQIIFGFFLKYMIADKAAIIVNPIFYNYEIYAGTYIWVAGFLYSLQLYADFMACSMISIGVSNLFGISIINNFNHPYFAKSIKEFWRKWHISLSSWLRDYIYFPLGGSKKGILRKNINIVITFAISGIWHGSGPKYLVWGLIHAGYQVIESVLSPVSQKVQMKFNISRDDILLKVFETIKTFILVMLAWIIFRADSLNQGLLMIKNMFTVYNPWVLADDSLLKFGLTYKDCTVLSLSILTLLLVGILQKRVSITDWVLKQNVVTRFAVYLISICVIWIFGTYGLGYEASSFIYGGF